MEKALNRTINLLNLQRMLRVKRADIMTYRQGKASRKCRRLTQFDRDWLNNNGSNSTSLEAAALLGHTPNAIRAYARRNGIQLKQVRHYE